MIPSGTRVILSTLFVLWALSGVAGADVAFPGRLQVEETEPGIFAVSFTLPIVEGRKLRAEPVLPPSCQEVTPREVWLSAGGHTTTWSVRCEPASLAGEAILIQGLLGTQTELAFTLATLDGRLHDAILKPSRPGFLVPQPPRLSTLTVAAVAAGARRVLSSPGLWMLMVVAVLLGARRRELLTAVAAFAVGHMVGQWLGSQGWLLVTPLVRDLVILATVVLPAIALAAADERWQGWLRPLWRIAALLALLSGGARSDTIHPGGLSSGEQLLALVLFNLGVGAGLALMAVAASELRSIFRLARRGSWSTPASRIAGYAAGALAGGMLLARFATLVLMPADATRAPLVLALLAALLGPFLTGTGVGGARAVLGFVGLAVVGLSLGLAGIPLPLGHLLPAASLLVLGLFLALDRHPPPRWSLPVAAVAVVTHTWLMTHTLVENVSRSTASAVGALLAAVCVLYASLSVSHRAEPSRSPVAGRLLGAFVVIAAAGWRLADYRLWFDREVATEAALGLLRVPVLAILLAVLALLAWPRRTRQRRALGIETKKSVNHWWLLLAAFLLLPIGTVAVRSPFFDPHAPRGEDARRVVSRVLSDTYRAFNLDDENELYDRLSSNVTDELVDDLYLDSRRRLRTGTREGAQVTVRDVSVMEIGEPVDAYTAGEGYVYDCRWVVTVRVRHLQHVHHRQNIYSGELTLRIDENHWKIGGVELRSEERVVVPWKST